MPWYNGKNDFGGTMVDTEATISKDERERSLYQSHLIYELDQRSEKASAILENARQIAKNLKSDGFPFDAISKNTGVPLEEVATL